MNTADLKKLVHKDVDGISRKQAGEAVDALFRHIAKALRCLKKVSLYKFGSLEVRRRKAGNYRNPKTGGVVFCGERKRVRFKESASLLDPRA